MAVHPASGTNNENNQEMKDYKFTINGNTYNVVIDSVSGDSADVSVNGVSYKVGIVNNNVSSVEPAGTDKTQPAVQIPEPSACTKPQTENTAQPSSSASAVTSPLPGIIIGVSVKIGDYVKAGQEVAVLEAMKMENSIESTVSGTVTAIHVGNGDSVLEGAAIVSIA